MSKSEEKQGLVQKAARALEIPKDVVFDLPKLTLIGDVQLVLENHRGIIEYTAGRIRIATSLGEFCVEGLELSIRNITHEEVHLEGRISGLQIIR